MTPQFFEALTDEALAAFWDVVAGRFPAARSGDLSPLTTIRLEQMARQAIEEWASFNVAGPKSDG
jgi:hypothetical protein